ncbi:MAG: 3-deoxy-manno-octulosonate cytidylyltransferase [Deltaproteobacteria bacterium]|nr:3-deoxy-manno-octulosonate cytidylyltransferase [Deltaproteobacteria bacterium]
MLNEQKKIPVLGVIPARMGSSRFPGKPLKLIHGKPMIWHVWQRCLLSNSLDDTVIATCDLEIKEASEAFGAKVIMTSDKHTRSNDRVAEVAEKIPCEIILNIQGDEPLVNPQLIDDVVNELKNRNDVQCINPISELKTLEEIQSPHTVKVVSNLKGRVLYLSRYAIPSALINERKYPVYRQVPILGFMSDFCIRIAKLDEGPLELQESIDLLRAVEHDMPLHNLVTEFQTIGVDTPEDMANVEIAMSNDEIYKRYHENT